MGRGVAMKIFIAGGTGFVGGHVVRELEKNGHSVYLLVHSRSTAGVEGERYVVGDVARLETFERLRVYAAA